MIKEKTVFIIGAGASCPYGFPSSAKLREEICLAFKAEYLEYVKANWQNPPDRDAKRWLINNFIDKFFNATESIDLFLAGNPTLAEIGKYIIAYKILTAEINSHFREQSQIRNQDWYSHVFKKMREGIVYKKDLNKFSENNISFITFNYDRSLEQFFYESLRDSFAEVPEQEIIQILNQLKIIHVYGSIAPLEWQNIKNGVKYKTPISERILQGTSQNLRTIYEEKQNPQLAEAKKLIAEANKIFFLGFGYAEENMDILGLPQIISLGAKIYGTGLGLEQKEREKIHSRVWAGLKPEPEIKMKKGLYEIIIEDMDCLKLLRNYL
ncbi:MAG: SIR2 family protein [Sedimentisphaerales bacterium]|jgi:hypothetical protein